ncbi:hypothetical protein [Mesotoga sp.]|uniref:hypothetical protein n=1 Tax=Mesotoga sp. TaxID=2053577 RepID=UPI001BD3F2C1|nr:hypothetical protein [Mesotoga sp.]MDD3459851.1 hypothetical protein [Mesotoga sp.]
MRGKQSRFIVALLFLVILVSSCGSSRVDLVPGRFAGFTMSGYMDISTTTSVGGRLLGFTLNEDSLLLHKEFAKGTKELSIYIAKFETASGTTSLWYSLIREISNEFRALVSAIPWIYGEFSGKIDGGFVKTWFSGKWLYLFIGSSKEEVNSAVDAFREFEKSLVRSVES